MPARRQQVLKDITMQRSSPPKKRIMLPPSIGKHFKITPKAQSFLGRLCELDSNSLVRELVFSTYPGDKDWNEMEWSQAKLLKRAAEVTDLKITRKKPEGLKFEVRPKDLCIIDPYPDFADSTVHPSPFIDEDDPENQPVLASITLGFHQAKRKWIYLLSKVEEKEDSPRGRRRNKFVVQDSEDEDLETHTNDDGKRPIGELSIEHLGN